MTSVWDDKDFIPPNAKPKCQWSKDVSSDADPHHHLGIRRPGKIFNSVLDNVGHTPLVRLNKIPKKYGLRCTVLAKCEFFSAGGSVKDRIALRMIEEAERDGILKPDYTIIEPTSGNTGIGLAVAAAVKGYKCIIVMPEKMSSEKADVLRALGATIVRTPTEAGYKDLDSHISVAYRLMKATPNSVILDQYRNPGNPLAHYDGLAGELLEATEGKIDMVSIGAGTGGTITGVGRRFKKDCPSCVIVGVDPEGSILAHNNENLPTGFYEVEGVGYDFLPSVFDGSVVDKWYKSLDKESFCLARELILEEGLLCGGSSGSALAAALHYGKDLNEDQTIVIVLPDGVRNYMTKFLDDNWMIERDFMPTCGTEKMPWYWNLLVGDVLGQRDDLEGVSPDFMIKDAIQKIKKSGHDQLAVLDDGKLVGVVTSTATMKKVVDGQVSLDDQVRKTMVRDFPRIKRSGTIGKLVAVLKRSPYAMVVEDHSERNHAVFSGVLRQIDLLNYAMVSDNYEQ